MTTYKTKKTGELSTKDGYEIAEYDNGAWRYTGDGGKTKGAIAIRPPEEEFTAELEAPMSAAKMSVLGHDKKEQLKQERIMEKVKKIVGKQEALTIHTPQDVAAYVAASLFSETLAFEKPLRDRVYTYERIGADAGLVSKYKDGKAGPTQAIQVNITISDKALAGIEASDEIIDALWEEE